MLAKNLLRGPSEKGWSTIRAATWGQNPSAAAGWAAAGRPRNDSGGPYAGATSGPAWVVPVRHADFKKADV